MIYFYTYLPHNIQNLHEYLDHFYQQMFAEVSPTFDKTLLIHADFVTIIDEYKIQILDKLEKMFNDYVALGAPDKEIVRIAYQNNNNIEGICNKTCNPKKFDELPAAIRGSVKSLYDNLWDSILKYARVVDKCGTVKQHFNAFRVANDHLVCPFCGLEGLLCEHDDGREDYDHYIPKGDYPFNCVNFINLVPMCHKCNSKYKGQVDPVWTEGTPPARRELFYPFDQNIQNHLIKVKIDESVSDLGRDGWTADRLNIEFDPATIGSMVDSWMDIFQIKSRYYARIRQTGKLLEDHIKKKYKRKLEKGAVDFAEFKNDMMDDLWDIKSKNSAVTEHAVYEYLFSNPDFEACLNSQVV